MVSMDIACAHNGRRRVRACCRRAYFQLSHRYSSESFRELVHGMSLPMLIRTSQLTALVRRSRPLLDARRVDWPWRRRISYLRRRSSGMARPYKTAVHVHALYIDGARWGIHLCCRAVRHYRGHCHGVSEWPSGAAL